MLANATSWIEISDSRKARIDWKGVGREDDARYVAEYATERGGARLVVSLSTRFP